jgi:hypothetical protein
LVEVVFTPSLVPVVVTVLQPDFETTGFEVVQVFFVVE